MPVGRFLLLPLLLLALVGAACGEERKVPMSMSLNSPAFAPNATIPARHTCDGGDVSPALQWSGLPDGAKSLALIVDDPDAPDPAAPQRTWVHWVLYNLPATAGALPEGVMPRNCRRARGRASTTGNGPAMAGLVRRPDAIAISTSFMRSTPCFPIWASRTRHNCSRRWKATCWQRRNWSAPISAVVEGVR